MSDELSGRGAAGPAPVSFVIERRVYYQHTDAGGVVFHANYLAFMEQARTELLMSLGFDVARLAADARMMFVVHRALLEFLRPARLNETLRITACAERVGRARVVFRQVVSREEQTLVSGEIQLACVHPQSFKPVPVPPALRTRLGYPD